MVTAWYDRYLKGLDTGVEAWPRVQVQGTDGQWRAEPELPDDAAGPAGQLALGAGGTLGTAEPEGIDRLHRAATDGASSRRRR